MPHQPLRIVDVNLNRSVEGLRVLEDVARFVLNDATLSQQLRSTRHSLAEVGESLGIILLEERDSEHDVGRENGIASRRRSNLNRQSYPDLASLVGANANRVEESLRVLEELAKLDELSFKLDAARFEKVRFRLYSVEKEMVSRLTRQDKLKELTGLYVIVDRQVLGGRDELEVAREVIQGGARVIQLRDKQRSMVELLPVAERLKELCLKAGILFIINDYLDLALAVDADGLHIGYGDLPVQVARRELPMAKIIGSSVTTVSRAIEVGDEGADYIAVGSMFPTESKEGAIVVGLDMLKQVREAVSSPVVAIGGIDKSNVGEVIAAGADCVAVISAVLSTPDVKKATKGLVSEIRKARRKCQG
ncbi:MAG: thiamine phosphate synthase [Dehalococcoidia bacterium]